MARHHHGIEAPLRLKPPRIRLHPGHSASTGTRPLHREHSLGWIDANDFSSPSGQRDREDASPAA